MAKMGHAYQAQNLPVILCIHEVTRLIEAARSLKYKVALSVAMAQRSGVKLQCSVLFCHSLNLLKVSTAS
ncbi:MAG: hypothetical protein V3U43_01475 [Pseudomonadales bacterium]